jgi:uncharacterized protein YndB with AHSA1/START domain
MTERSRIEKKILLHASRARVWRALTDSTEFGQWFGVRFDGPFMPGARIRGTSTPTIVDDTIAKMQKAYEGAPWEVTIDRIEPERVFSFRWHPFAVDPNVDYSDEATTLVVFELEEIGRDVMLTVTESGFERIPLERRIKAFTANEQGWGFVVTLVEKYVAQAS